MKEITLDHPFARGEQKLEKISILEPPGTGWLRGVKLFDLVQMDATALATVLPRITTPALTEEDIRGKLHPADLFQMGDVVAGFLLPKSAKAAASLPA
jgi:hypothetical protein